MKKPVLTLHVTSNRIVVNGKVNPAKPDDTIKSWAAFRSSLPVSENLEHNLGKMEEFRREGE